MAHIYFFLPVNKSGSTMTAKFNLALGIRLSLVLILI